MPYNPKEVSQTAKIIFPIAVTIIAGLIAPQSLALVGFLMFGNLIRECGVLEGLAETARTALVNIVTLLLGISIAFKMKAAEFLTWQTLMIMVLGLGAFVFDTIGGVLFAKTINLFTKKKINPMVGAAGISAFPMSARVVQKMGLEADPENHLLMHAVSANVSGQIASVLAGGDSVALHVLRRMPMYLAIKKVLTLPGREFGTSFSASRDLPFTILILTSIRKGRND